MKYLKISIGIAGLIAIISWGAIGLIKVKTLNNPDLLIVESWLPSTSLEQANEYILKNKIDSVWIVGMNKSDTSIFTPEKKEKINLPTGLIGNGYISVDYNSIITSDTLLIDIEGYNAFNIGAFILIYTNEKLVLSKIISGRDCLKIPCSRGTNNLTLFFANDARCKKGEDRNVTIYSISDVTDRTGIEKKYGGTDILPHKLNLSEGLKTKLYFQELGCSAKQFTIVEGKAKGSNKTLQSSLLFKKWLSENYIANKKLRINVFTTPQHAKRTYINYKNAMKNFAEVGVYTFENSNQTCEGLSTDKKFSAWADETASTAFSYFYWLFH